MQQKFKSKKPDLTLNGLLSVIGSIFAVSPDEFSMKRINVHIRNLRANSTILIIKGCLKKLRKQ